MMIMVRFLEFSFWLLFASAAAALEFSGAKSGCDTKCGNITVSYPFGIGVKCARNRGHFITCNRTFTPHKPFIEDGNLEIVGITATEVRIKTALAFKCYNRSGYSSREHDGWIDLKTSPYTFSQRNNFYSVGCNTIGFIGGRDKTTFNDTITSGCLTVCRNKESVSNGSCAGVGCCQTAIPKKLKYWSGTIGRPYLEWNVESYNFSPCSYAFLADQDEFKFHASDISRVNFTSETVDAPIVLDWVIDNRTCRSAQRDLKSYACSGNTSCVDSDNGPGYRCECRDGYKGNPYLSPGCQDIDECEGSNNKCLSRDNCFNFPGSYNCICPRGTTGDGRKDGRGCNPESKAFPITAIVLGVGFGLLLLLVGSSSLYFGLRKRRVAQERAKFFKQNGGLLLQQHQLSSHEGGAVKLTRIYTTSELREATNNYDESRILGQGANGTVYKGIFPHDGMIVAIKKSKFMVESQVEQFINEVVILTQINHRNVVKLLGCCLETEVPLLVYEYITNGTLYEHIHKMTIGGRWMKLSWPNRLRIAIETAGALAYLHSAASIPIIHRDVKSANILLDDSYSAKVADFGASRLVPVDQTQISTLVQGTIGYLDPEYLQTSQLTEKSDVYSFGVVLVELLTGQKPFSCERSEERKNLATSFILSMRENALLQIVDEHLVEERYKEQMFSVAELAISCLDLRGEVRPTMREVVGELEKLPRVEGHPWVEENGKETTNLLDDACDLYPRPSDSFPGESSEQYLMNDSMMLQLNAAR